MLVESIVRAILSLLLAASIAGAAFCMPRVRAEFCINLSFLACSAKDKPEISLPYASRINPDPLLVPSSLPLAVSLLTASVILASVLLFACFACRNARTGL